MALLIKDENIAALAPMSECVEAMEIALAENAQGLAPFYPRRVNVPGVAADGTPHGFGAQMGSVSHFSLAAIRLNSGRRLRERGEPRGANTAGYMDRDWGVVVLFDMRTGELAAILPQFTLSGIRVGATTGVAVKHLARQNASVVGVFGSSKVARADLEAVAQVRPIREAKVFSPNPEHRMDFAKEMSARLDVEVRAVDDPRLVVEGSDVVCCSTSSNGPVFDGAWLRPGQLVTSTKSTPRPREPLSRSLRARHKPEPLVYRTEIDRTTLVRSDAICILSEELVINEQQHELLDPMDEGLISWDKIHELGNVILGTAHPRQREEDLVFYASTGGMGIQMAAAGAVVLKHAREKGVGTEVSHEWFSASEESWHAKGYYPSP